jgi:hypothetical protein
MGQAPRFSLWAILLTSSIACQPADDSRGSAMHNTALEVAAETGAAETYSLEQSVATWVSASADAVRIGDVTGDGRADVVLATNNFADESIDDQLLVFAQQSDGSLAAPVRYPYGRPVGTGATLALADLNADGVLDVIVGSLSGLYVVLSDGAGGLRKAQSLTGQHRSLAAADLDHDGNADVVACSSVGLTLYYGNGTGALARTGTLTAPLWGSEDNETGDFNADGRADIGVLFGDRLAVYLQDQSGGLTMAQSLPVVAQSSRGIGLGDVNDDRRLDAVVSRETNVRAWLDVYLQDATGKLTEPIELRTYAGPEPIVIADLDRDGDDDIGVLHGSTSLGIYLQSECGLGEETLYPLPYATHYSPQGLALGDYTGDGCADVAIANYNAGLVTLRGRCPTRPPGRVPPCTRDAGADAPFDGGSDGTPDTGTADGADATDTFEGGPDAVGSADASADASDDVSTDASTGGTTGNGSSGSAGSGAGGTPAIDAGPSGGRAGSPPHTGDANAGTGGGSKAAAAPNTVGVSDEGCGCRVPRSPHGTSLLSWFALLLVGAARARAQRRSRLQLRAKGGQTAGR